VNEYYGTNPQLISDARSSAASSLALIRREAGEEVVIKVLSTLILEASLFFNVAQSITPSQVTQSAHLILKRYYYLNLADIKLCIEMGKSGDFGKIYDRFDGGVVMNWFSEYTFLRSEI